MYIHESTVEKGNWNGPVKGLGKDVPGSTCTFSRNWRIYNRIIMYISYSALISITIEQTTKSMKSFLLVQYQGDNQISMHASHNRIPILMTTSNQKRAIILVEKIFYDICEKKIFIKVRDSHENFFYEDFFYSAISR